MRLVLKIAGLAAVLALATGVEAGGDSVKLEARLAGAPGQMPASGKAKFESRADRVRFSAQVEDTAGVAEIEVVVDGATVGFAMLDPASGQFDLNLDSRDGDTVAAMAAGDRVEVRNAADGALVASGTLE